MLPDPSSLVKGLVPQTSDHLWWLLTVLLGMNTEHSGKETVQVTLYTYMNTYMYANIIIIV